MKLYIGEKLNQQTTYKLLYKSPQQTSHMNAASRTAILHIASYLIDLTSLRCTCKNVNMVLPIVKVHWFKKARAGQIQALSSGHNFSTVILYKNQLSVEQLMEVLNDPKICGLRLLSQTSEQLVNLKKDSGGWQDLVIQDLDGELSLHSAWGKLKRLEVVNSEIPDAWWDNTLMIAPLRCLKLVSCRVPDLLTQKATSLIDLTLSKCNVTNEMFESLGILMPNLVSLTLMELVQLLNADVLEQAEQLEHLRISNCFNIVPKLGRMRNLRTLWLNSVKNLQNVTKDLEDKCPDLEEVSFEGSEISQHIVAHLSQRLNLKRVSILGVGMDGLPMSRLIGNSPNLEVLCIGNLSWAVDMGYTNGYPQARGNTNRAYKLVPYFEIVNQVRPKFPKRKRQHDSLHINVGTIQQIFAQPTRLQKVIIHTSHWNTRHGELVKWLRSHATCPVWYNGKTINPGSCYIQ